MADNLTKFELVSPERLLLSREVEMVEVPGGEGDFGALAQHTRLLSTLRPGIISVHEGGKVTERIFVAGGFAEVTERRCTVLAEGAVPVAEIDVSTSEQELKDAREDLADAKDDKERQRAEKQIAVAQARIAAAG